MLAKNRTIPVFLIGHVTKDGSIAGPKALEHIVDTVLYFEGERHHNHRIVRATKNRFGAANELGVFEMTGEGLVAVANPSEMFLQGGPRRRGLNRHGMHGGDAPRARRDSGARRPARSTTTRAHGAGVRREPHRAPHRYAGEARGLPAAQGDDVFVNVVGGLEIDEPAADLGVIAAIVSSFRNLPVDPKTAVFGEVGLTGEVRGAMQAQARAREAQALGFKKIIMPASNTAGARTSARRCACVGVDARSSRRGVILKMVENEDVTHGGQRRGREEIGHSADCSRTTGNISPRSSSRSGASRG
jgi:DNA repair protein RadA/Sms